MTSTRPAPKPENLLRRPAHPDISEALVHDLVFAFYDRIRADATLGPIFDGIIGDRWDEHLAKMFDFWRSEEHTSELQSLMRISYAVFCLKQKTHKLHDNKNTPTNDTSTHHHTITQPRPH